MDIPQRIIEAGFSVVDKSLSSASYYAEKANHIVRSPTYQTEKFYDGFEGELHSPIAQVIEGVRDQLKRGLPITLSLANGLAVVNAVTAETHGGLDDRKMLLEFGLTFMSRLPPDSEIARKCQHKIMTMLWYDLCHPPATHVGKQYRFRSPDGSGYALYNPEMGKAGSSYARSVISQNPLPLNQLPSPSLLFDCLLKRESQVAHPAGLSSFFFAFANLVIHQVFNTDHLAPEDEAINKTSSYIDLAIIYGNNQREQDSVRAFDGYGNLLPDTFADSRLLRMPPSTPALLVLLCRNHNFIASRLLEVNEHGKWQRDLSLLDAEGKKRQDEDLFQTARLVNCGTVMNIVLADYLSSILGLVRYANGWSLDLLETFREESHEFSSVGQGNAVSVEFTALYHFHATISQADEKWVEGAMGKLFPSAKSWDDISTKEYKGMIKGLLQHADKMPPPNKWTFGNLKRSNADGTGTFDDKELADILKNAMEVPAGAFGARRTPHAMKIIEMMAIEQNRAWGTCSMNEFRKFLGLKPFKTFEEWNPRRDVAEAARRLYHHPDNLELYVGLQAEAAKEAVAGAGLCPGYTVSRAILGDAAALVRGDRFLTTDLTSYNLTCWGLMDTKRHADNASFGGILPKLLMRALPGQFDPESVYTQFPMMVPSEMKKHLAINGIGHKYNYDRPPTRGPVVAITKYADVQAVLNHPSFAAPYVINGQAVLPGFGYLATFNRSDLNIKDTNNIRQAFLAGANPRKHIEYFGKTTAQLIMQKSYTLPGTTQTRVNIVKDVINILPAHFISTYVIGLPLKTATKPVGSYYEQELQEKLWTVYDYIFISDSTFINDQANNVKVKDSAMAHAAEFRDHVLRHFDSLGGSMFALPNVTDLTTKFMLDEPTNALDWLKRLLSGSGKDHSELANDVVTLAVALSAEYSQTLTHIIDILIDEPYKSTIVALSNSRVEGTETIAKIKEIIAEAVRLAPAVPGVVRETTSDATIGTTKYARGTQVFLSLVDANYDTSVFPDADKIATGRDKKPLYGDGIFRLLGEDWVLSTMAVIVKGIFSLGNVARDTDYAGTLLAFKTAIPGGTKVRQYLTMQQEVTPWSSHLTLTFTPGPSAPQPGKPFNPLITPFPPSNIDGSIASLNINGTGPSVPIHDIVASPSGSGSYSNGFTTPPAH